ncbi:hypothetical protein ACFL4T_05340 [candidate division KSB1 bacterium]
MYKKLVTFINIYRLFKQGQLMTGFKNIIFFSFVFLIFSNLAAQDKFPVLKGPYLGQKPPEDKAVLFAPGIVKNCPSFTPDRTEFYFRGNDLPGIIFMKLDNNRLSSPQNISFSTGLYSDYNPHLSPDGKKLVFASNRPVTQGGKPKDDPDIYIVERAKNGWSVPVRFNNNINSPKTEGCPTLSESGNLYFFSDRKGGQGFDIYVSNLINGKYQNPNNLGPSINTRFDEVDPFIAPDESYLIFCVRGREDGFGNNDLYISFRTGDNSWTEPVNMGEKINTNAEELFPRTSNDGRYLFFSSTRRGKMEVFWIDAKIIEDLKRESLK